MADLGLPTRTQERGRGSDKRWVKTFDFDHLGFHLTYDVKREVFASISFGFNTAAIKAGSAKPFKGLLHAGIKPTDTRDLVEQRMGVKPYFVTDQELKKKVCGATSYDAGRNHWENYELPPYHFTYIFDAVDEGISLVDVDLSRRAAAAQQ